MFGMSPTLNRVPSGYIGLDSSGLSPLGEPMFGSAPANPAPPAQPGLFAAQPRSSPPSPAPSPQGIAAAASPNPTAAGKQGMFANKPRHGIDAGAVIGALLAGALGMEAGRGVPGAAEQLRSFQEAQMYQRKKRDADAQTASYVQALIANGMDPNLATIMAADPSEMAKHIGTRFDAATIDEGSTRATPNLDGSMNAYTAPKTFQHNADVVQMPGSQTVAPPFGQISGDGVPQSLGAPTAIPGLRPDAEQYADSVAQRGSPVWNNALQDFTLKGNGPTAFGFDQSLQNARLANQRSIASQRIAASTANNVRSTDARLYATDHRAGPHAAAAAHAPTPSTVVGGIMAKQAAGQPLTPSEQNTLRDYRTHYKPQHGAVQISGNEPVAVGPNGQRMVVRNGQWVPAQ